MTTLATATDVDASSNDHDRVAITAKSGRPKFLRRLRLAVPLLLLAIWTFLPFLVAVSVSFKSKVETFANLSLIPDDPGLTAYREVIEDPNFTSAFINSVIVGIGTTIVTIVVGLPAAYAFARFNFRGRHFLLLFTLLPRLVPTIGVLVPIYRLAVELGVLDKRLTLIVVYSGTLVPLAVWLMVGFFRQIPKEIEEAAALDGATLWNRLRYIMMPLAAPALITIAVLAFREAWNEFTLVLVLTTSPDTRTLPYALFKLSQSEGISNYPAQAAFAILTILPFILVYSRIEKYIVAGVASGGGK